MAVMEMKRIGIYARKSDRKRILELLQRKGVVEVHSPQEAEELFSKTDTTAARATFEKNAQLLLQSAAVLDKYAPPPRQLPQILRDNRYTVFSGTHDRKDLIKVIGQADVCQLIH